MFEKTACALGEFWHALARRSVIIPLIGAITVICMTVSVTAVNTFIVYDGDRVSVCNSLSNDSDAVLKKLDIEFDDIKKFKIDTLLGERAKEIVTIGDFVTFYEEPQSLSDTKITAKALDDRAGVVCLLELARRLSGKMLPINVVFALSDAEELGVRGAKTATYDVSPDEAIALDVSFADGPDIPSTECGKLSGGAMIGVSPILDRQISNTLKDIAKENGISYQTEVMAGRTGTNGDVISLNKTGVKTGLSSIPERNMHTAVEVVDLKDITAVCDILEQYILKGGVKNA